jgi:cytochrome b involved in lipid metabolism
MEKAVIAEGLEVLKTNQGLALGLVKKDMEKAVIVEGSEALKTNQGLALGHVN